jgi:acetyltransferase-like isoleucine patch superfamily enzyme
MKQQLQSRWQRLLEIVLTTSLEGIPLRVFGSKLRTLLYRLIFHRIGRNVYIQNGVQFLNTSCIEIGNSVWINRGAIIDAGEHCNNRISIGDDVQIKYGVTFEALNNTEIIIEKGALLSAYVCIGGPGNIKIGKACMIAANTGIYANNHIFSDLTRDIALQGVTREGIIIEDDCWLGHGVTVLDGVIIGKGSVIGAGSVVTKDIPPYSVAVGVPAKVIKSRNPKFSTASVSSIIPDQVMN